MLFLKKSMNWKSKSNERKQIKTKKSRLFTKMILWLFIAVINLINDLINSEGNFYIVLVKSANIQARRFWRTLLPFQRHAEEPSKKMRMFLYFYSSPFFSLLLVGYCIAPFHLIPFHLPSSRVAPTTTINKRSVPGSSSIYEDTGAAVEQR